MLTKSVSVLCVLILLAGVSISRASVPQPGDANEDGLVDLKDATIVNANFGQNPRVWGQGDFNSDTAVDLQDWGLLKTNFGLVSGQPGSGTPDTSLTLVIDLSTEDAWLKNTTGAALGFDGYEIWSAGGLLAPTGWQSIADSVNSQPLDVLLTLGTGALSFGELTATQDLLAEFSLLRAATLPAGGIWYIGEPAPQASLADLAFFYSRPGVADTKYQGGIEIVPEPATLGLLLVGGLALLRRRRF